MFSRSLRRGFGFDIERSDLLPSSYRYLLQLIDRSIEQSINRWIDQSINIHSTNQQTNQLTNQPTNQPTNQSINQQSMTPRECQNRSFSEGHHYIFILLMQVDLSCWTLCSRDYPTPCESQYHSFSQGYRCTVILLMGMYLRCWTPCSRDYQTTWESHRRKSIHVHSHDGGGSKVLDILLPRLLDTIRISES